MREISEEFKKKRDEVWGYCLSHYGNCKGCKLKVGGWNVPLHDFKKDSCLALGVFDEQDLDRALSIINENVQPQSEPDNTPNEEVDLVNHPPHYTHGGMECIDEMILIFGVEAVMNFCACNAWKYRKRAPYKGTPEQDMEKSDWYIKKYKELKEDVKSEYKSR